jgi:Tol biopolymer transport system component
VYLHDRITGETPMQSVCGPDLDGNGASALSQASNDGRYVAFSSVATNLETGDTNGKFDVFVRDRLTGATERVSVRSSGGQGNNDSNAAHLSAEGRYVAFQSWSGNLVPGPAGVGSDVLVHDRATGQTERVNVSTAGVPSNAASEVCEISRDGRYVVFMSLGSNLVAGDTNGKFDVFVRDRVAGQTQRVSVSSAGAQGNEESRFGSISADGRYVAFHSRSGNLVPNDTNSKYDVFVRDLQTSQTTRVSVSTLGVQGDDSSGVPHISADGRFVSFESFATNLVTGDTNGSSDIFVHDRLFGETQRVSVPTGGAGAQANGTSEQSSISADGRWVCFRSSASNLIFGDINGAADIFVRDRVMGQTHLVSVDSTGMQVGGTCNYPRISDDGRFVAFTSDASDLVAGDTNGVDDVFLHDRTPLAPTTFCYGDGSETPCPCASDGATGHGCINAQATGGVVLSATGTQAANDVVLHGTGYPPASSPGVIVMRSKDVEPVPVLFGDGLRCIAAVGLVRLSAASASGGASAHPLSHGAGPGTFHYQLWYRNTPATFCTSAAFNLSSGLSIVW